MVYSTANEANLVLINAHIWTPGPTKPKAGAIAVGGGRILRVGSNAKCEAEGGKDSRVLDVAGRLVLPGFIDSHAHLMHTGPRLVDWLQFDAARSMKQVLAELAQEARRRKPGSWILGRAWDESTWPERRFPTRLDLDRISSRNPILIRRIDGHMSVVNTAAIRVLRIPRGTVGFEIGRDGQPTGVLKEKAAELAGEKLRPSVQDLERTFVRMTRLAHRLGITSVHDVVNENGFQAYLNLHRRGALDMRVSLMPEIKSLRRIGKGLLSSLKGDEWLRLGALKVYADGSLGSRTAALHEPYADSPRTRGQLTYHGDRLKRLVSRAHRAEFQLAIHAIGDRGIDAVLDVYQHALRECPREDHRHRIEHLELPTEEALDRCSELGVLPVMQPNFVAKWSQPGGMYEARLGRERTARNNPHKLILGRGLRIAFGSDGMPYGPLFGLRGAVPAPYPNQRIALHHALEAYTSGGAYASFEENLKGRIERGYSADLTVVEGSWDGCSRSLAKWKVAATIVGGKIMYKTAGVKEA